MPRKLLALCQQILEVLLWGNKKNDLMYEALFISAFFLLLNLFYMRFTFLFLLTVLSISVYSQEYKTQGPYLSIETDTLRYGKIKLNSNGERSVEIKNIGNETLIITSCKASCGCTIPLCPTSRISPNDSSEIKIVYDTKRSGIFSKTLTIKSNAINNTYYLKIIGEVIP